MRREDDFEERRKHLANMSESELEAYFWELAEKIVDPLVDLAYNHTTPSIERSVLLRMGFSSIEAKSIVENAIDRGLIGKGVGNIVYKYSKHKGLGIREAGLLLIEPNSWDEVKPLFNGGAN